MSSSDAIHRANVWPSGNGLATILQVQKNFYVGLQYQTRTDYPRGNVSLLSCLIRRPCYAVWTNEKKVTHFAIFALANMFAALVQWIQQEGGHVHPGLELRDKVGDRGIFARNPICCGEILIRLPGRLSIHCGTLDVTNGCHHEGAAASVPVSPWLRCLVALYRVRSKCTDFYKPYLDSLPSHYETLFEWSDEQVSNYLAGTTIGRVTQSERQHHTLQCRYMTSVRPILEKYGVVSELLPNEMPSQLQQELATFLEACICISTRAFHLSAESERDSEDVISPDVNTESFNGPFLLPLIDLLNHDFWRKCTTLQSDGTTFLMKAERDIGIDEEIFHSYGDQLCAAQFLQTFGFVPNDAVRFVCDRHTPRASLAVQQRSTCLTPAVLSKACLVDACHQIATSDYPAKLRQHMNDTGMNDDEVWDMPLDMKSRDLSLISDDLPVQSNPPVLTEEMITLCSLLLIPTDAYDPLLVSGLSLLDRSVLDDYYLGMLVCRTIVTAIASKRCSYTPLITIDEDSETLSSASDDRSFLVALLDRQAHVNNNGTTTRRAINGITVRLEEKSCLQALESEVNDIMTYLERGYSLDVAYQIKPVLESKKQHVRKSGKELASIPRKRPRLD